MTRSARCLVAIGVAIALTPSWLPTLGPRAPLTSYKPAAIVTSLSLSTWIRTTFPLQSAATQNNNIPATKRWALLIGLNDYAGTTVSNIGSRQDATELYAVLLKLGWRKDHIMLIVDLNGTASHIIDAIRWLASKTNAYSTVVFHYSGHENWTRTLADGDNETKDVEIWAADNRMIIDGTVGREMNRVAAYHMWIDFSTCRAAGFNDPGMIKAGRILTYSSTVDEFSYEDPHFHHSVFGWYMINMGIYLKYGDANHDGKVSIEEAFAFARPHTVTYTRRLQWPVGVDKVLGSMYLTIP